MANKEAKDVDETADNGRGAADSGMAASVKGKKEVCVCEV